MRKTTILSVAFAAVCLVMLVIVPCSALTIDFESGTDWDAIGTIDGVTFTTADGYDLVYADIANDDWAFKSSDGLVNEPHRYYINGHFAAVSPDDNVAWIGFEDPMSYCNVGYSSQFSFIVEAYASDKTTLLDSASGGSNWWDGSLTTEDISGQLAFLPVNHAGIYWLKVFADQGEYPISGNWVIDDVSARGPDSPNVPEWPAALLALSGIPGLVAIRRRYRAN